MSSQEVHDKASKDDASSSILPDAAILFPPYNSFVRELVNNSMQLRALMKPRWETAEEPVKKKPATQVMKKPAKNEPAKNQP